MNESFRSHLASLPPEEPVRCIVRYKSPQAKERSRLPSGVGQLYSYELFPGRALLGSASDIESLQDDNDIETIWHDLSVHTMLDVSVPRVQAPKLWNAGFEGQGVRVAIVDTGIDAGHPDFEGRIVSMADFTRTDGDGQDDNGHGTHVAGAIAGSGEASGGKYIGVAPEAELLAAKVLRGDGSGLMSDVMAGIEWAVEQGAHVINLSLGSDTPCDGSDALSTLCDAAVAEGVVVCVAAGNAGPRAGTVGSPGCAHDVITVGATTDDDDVTSFSSRGPTKDGRVKPDVCFPGHNIVSARAKGTAMGTPVDAYYTSASGTSMATPHAAGAAALLLQAVSTLAPADVKGRLMATAVDMDLEANVQGAGRGDIWAAYQHTGPLPPPEPPPPEPPPEEPPGCLTLGQSPGRSGDDAVRGGLGREAWWVIGALLLLCLCVVCSASVLIAIALGVS